MLEVESIEFLQLGPLSLSVKEGESLVVFGPNGCGKTTLLNLLYGKLKPRLGNIKFQGKFLGNMNVSEKARHISFLPANFEDSFGFTVFEHVLFGRFSNPVLQNEKEAEASLKEFNITHLKNKYFEDLSSGEKRKVMLARIDYQNTDIIILDEPTSFLDYKSQKKFYEWILRKKKQNKIVIFSTHSLDVDESCITSCLFFSIEDNNNKIIKDSYSKIKSQLI